MGGPRPVMSHPGGSCFPKGRSCSPPARHTGPPLPSAQRLVPWSRASEDREGATCLQLPLTARVRPLAVPSSLPAGPPGLFRRPLGGHGACAVPGTSHPLPHAGSAGRSQSLGPPCLPPSGDAAVPPDASTHPEEGGQDSLHQVVVATVCRCGWRQKLGPFPGTSTQKPKTHTKAQRNVRDPGECHVGRSDQ